MAKALPAPDRVVLLLSLVPYLLERGEATLAELAEAFGAPVAVLRELVEFLGTAGVPGETSTYQDEDLFDIDWEALERRDLVRLTRAVAVDDSPRFSAAEQAALLAGLQALAPLLPESAQPDAVTAAEKLAAAAVDRVPGAPDALSLAAEPQDPRLRELTAAIGAGQRVAFAYRDLRGVESARTVEPLSLTQSNGAWYLRGYCLERSDERTFLVDGMRELRTLSEAAGHRPTTAPGRSAFDPAGAAIRARARAREAALPRIAAFSPRTVAPIGGGWVRIEIDLAHPGAAARLVQLAPGDVIVDAPEAARMAVRDWAERALARYGA